MHTNIQLTNAQLNRKNQKKKRITHKANAFFYCLDSSALLLRKARRRRTVPLGVKWEKAAPAQARRKQNRLW